MSSICKEPEGSPPTSQESILESCSEQVEFNQQSLTQVIILVRLRSEQPRNRGLILVRADNYLFSKVPRPALELIRPPIQWTFRKRGAVSSFRHMSDGA